MLKRIFIDLILAKGWKLFAASAAGGICVLIATAVFDRGSPVVYQSVAEASPVASRPGYVGIVIDRTRARVCAVHSTRILIRNESVNGVMMPVILPLQENGIVWPIRGHARFMLLVPLPSDLPPGQWFTQSVSTDYCHWWDFITGGTVRMSPLIPISSQAVSAARNAQ